MSQQTRKGESRLKAHLEEAKERIEFEGEGYRTNPVDGNCRL